MTRADKRVTLDWKPRRNGLLYCSPACGGRCTFAAYKAAKRKAKTLAAELGEGWHARVWENLGWHYSVDRPHISVSPSGSGYMAIIAGNYIGHSRRPVLAIRDAIRKAKPSLEACKELLKYLEAGV